ncbi:hypothetical protein NDA01_21610 [Trichocoleus desertorum AS-A10]|uniref:hypothetical protein n=1 Tax=Trichocoleus desertorum TaxID=1481672 RepID=UPI00329A6ABA
MGRVFGLIGILVVGAILFDPMWSAIKQIKGTNTALIFLQGVMQQGKKASTAENPNPSGPAVIEVSVQCDDYKAKVAATAQDLGGAIDPNKLPCPTGL